MKNAQTIQEIQREAVEPVPPKPIPWLPGEHTTAGELILALQRFDDRARVVVHGDGRFITGVETGQGGQCMIETKIDQ